MLPQFDKFVPFDWENIREGFTLILWGMFKKVLIADNLALIVNAAYKDPLSFSSLELIFASLCYSAQIYCDFSGYSDIAKGSAKLLGIDLSTNFNAPYLATSIRDFWRRWHISLSSWLRDYLYFPLGGSRKGLTRQCLNILIVFFVSGLWHGNGLTFIVWGLFHGVLQLIEILIDKIKTRQICSGRRICVRTADNNPPKECAIIKLIKIIITFLLVNISWIFFRADELGDAIYIIKRMMLVVRYGFVFNIRAFGVNISVLLVSIIACAVVLFFDYFNQKINLLQQLNKTVYLRYGIYTAAILTILLFGYYGSGFDPMDFVYFKF